MRLVPVIVALVGASVALAQVSVNFNILRGRDIHTAQKRSFGKRDGGIVRANILDEQVFYAANITIAGAEYSVLIDTGSSDLWVYGSTNPYCTSNGGTSKERLHGFSPADLWRLRERNIDSTQRPAGVHSENLKPETTPTLEKRGFSTSISQSEATIDCEMFGVFDTESQQWSTDGQLFLIQYVDMTYAIGYYGTSVVSFGNATLDGLTFAVANTSNASTSICGIGFEGNEASTGTYMDSFGGAFQYQNYPSALKASGLIARNMYSMWMDSDTAEGVVLFGAIDHSKYLGDLATMSLLNYYIDSGFEQPVTFDVSLNSLSLSDGETRSMCLAKRRAVS
ncbi:unnamed protein product [Cyberlindnera jadinii]|uniref:Peptidase A1 domain-containing protein n=1 Tax=Cyberlindnera jadinii (strain ATCC 18201 / CBS 1600 / BCRC 20928 / JCM 3617 / NBRC 0987 / NRRL Y-1542) TaxID=983966 RepID=A0A0H5CAF4_CYBJN|nr:unnamed protein product [Cyberlindnera jadinii]